MVVVVLVVVVLAKTRVADDDEQTASRVVGRAGGLRGRVRAVCEEEEETDEVKVVK